MAQQFDVPFLREIPLVKAVSEAGDSGEPIVLDAAHPVALAFADLAEKVAQQIAITNANAEMLA